MGTTVNGISQSDYAKLSPEVKRLCESDERFQARIAKLLSRRVSVDEINNWYASNGITGLSVESGDASDPAKKLENLRTVATSIGPDQMDNKSMRELNQAQWEAYFRERYAQNPAEAREDITRIFFREEVFEVKEGLQKMMRDTKLNMVLKTKYLAEGFATEEEKEAYKKRKADLIEQFINAPRAPYDKEIERLEGELAKITDKESAEAKDLLAQIEDQKSRRAKACSKAALDAYNSMRPPHEKVEEKDWVQAGEYLDTEQIMAIIDLKALDAIDVTEGKIEKMAIKAVSEQNFNHGLAEVKKKQDEIDKLKEEGSQSPEVQKIQGLAITKNREYEDRIKVLLEEAETDDSRRLREEATKANIEMREEVARLRKAGKDKEADALEAKRIKAKEDAEKAINGALDQTKLEEANKLTREKEEAWAKAGKDAYNAMPEKIRKKITQLENQIQKTMKKANKDNNAVYSDNIDDLIATMAEAQVKKQCRENKFNNKKVEFAKLDKDIRAWIEEEPEKFCQVVETEADIENARKDGTLIIKDFPELDGEGRQLYNPDGTKKTKQVFYKFDGDKFKEEILRYSNDNELNNDQADNARYRADYYADIQDRKKIARDRKGDEVPDKMKDRRFAARCFKAAGIDFETDKTLGKQIGHVTKAFVQGFAAGSVAGLAAEFLATTHVVEKDWFKLVEYSGSVPWSKMVHYSGSTDYRFQKHLEGDEAYHQELTVEGEATGTVTLGYSGSKGYHVEGDVDYTVTGVAHGDYNGTATGTVTQTHTDYQNGIPIGSYEKDVDVSIPYSGSLDIPYEHSGTAHWTHDGVVFYSGTTSGEVSIPYKQVVYADGTVHWVAEVDEVVSVDYEGDVLAEGTAEYSGTKEASGTTSGRPTINLKNVLGIGLSAGIANALRSLGDVGKIRDEGRRDTAIRAQVLSEKGVEEKPVEPPKKEEKDPKVPPEYEYIEECRYIEGEDGEEGTPDEDVVNIKMNQKGNVIFWYQTAEAYDIPQGLTAKDVYNRIRELNGDPNHNKYAPDEVGLPLEIEVKGFKVRRKDSFTIKGINYKPEKGKGKALGKGTTYVGYKGKEGRDGHYEVRSCADNSVLYTTKTRADAEHWDQTNARKRTRVKKEN